MRRPKDLFDIIAIVFLLAHLALLLCNWNNYPTELDTPYHLLMGKLFADNGALTLWDSYEFAPAGRPNLYPPLQHLIVWLLKAVTNASYMDIGRIIVIVQTILALILVFLFSRRLFGSRTALFSLVLFASGTESWWWQTSVAPIALITVLFLPFLYAYYKKKIVLSALLLTACLYLNYGLSSVLAGAILFAAIAGEQRRKERLKEVLVVLGASVLLFSPWLLHMYRFRPYLFSHAKGLGNLPVFSARVVWPEILLNLNVLLWFCAAAGAVHCWRNLKSDFKYRLLLSAFVWSFIFLFLFRGVRFNAHTPVISSVIAGLGASFLMDKIASVKNAPARMAAAALLFLSILFTVFFEFHFLTPALAKQNEFHIAAMGLGRNEVWFRPTPFLNELKSIISGKPLKGKHRVRIQDFFRQEDTAELLDYLKGNVGKDAVLHINNGALGAYITLATGIRTDSGMYWEVMTPQMKDAIERQRASGIYVSTDEYFRKVLPKERVIRGQMPRVVKKIGRFYIGYL